MYDVKGWMFQAGMVLGALVATRSPIPARYSTSSSRVPTNNFCYFSLEYPKGEVLEKFLVKSRPTRLGFEGIAWPAKEDARFPESQRGVEICLPMAMLGVPRFDIMRVYGSQSIRYTSVAKYLIGELTFLAVRLHRKEVREQTKFENRFRFTAERISTLRAIIDWRREDVAQGTSRQALRSCFSQFALYTQLFSIRAWEVKGRDKHLAELELVLDSLVSSGDLGRDNHGYIIQGKALQTLSDFETNDRRAKAAERGNTRMFWLTVVITIATAIQAYFVAFPAGALISVPEQASVQSYDGI